MADKLTVSIVVYTKNEIDGLKVIMPKIKKEWYDQLVFIDGRSTDGTMDYIKEHGYECYIQKEPYWAGAYQEAFERATGDIIVDFSPDGNSIPELIPELVKKVREGYDMVIASRYTGGAKSEDDTKITGFGNFLFTTLINVLFGAHYTDSLVVYRAYRRTMLEKAGMLNVPLDQGVTALLGIRCAKIKGRTADIPGDEPKRIGGEPKMNVIKDGLRALFLIFKELIFWDVRAAAKHRIPW